MCSCRITSIVVFVTLAPPALAQNLLVNGSFETVGPVGPQTTMTGVAGLGHSAALGFGVFNNIFGTTTTELVPSTLPGGGAMMLHITTDNPINGIGQSFGVQGAGPACVISSVNVFVVSGSIFIGAGNGGQTSHNAFSATTGQWELLRAENVECPVNNFIIYAASEGGADFFVDLASVVAVGCQGPPGDLNFDGSVDGADLGLLLLDWGLCREGGGCPADLTNDGEVNGADLGFLLINWGCDPD
jgi:hypothetical protein